ncbi:peptidoglycan-binding protein [Streptomyces sp. NPDC014882]|uniref:peptidoglycan-binding domain-containing protein n=1 Tax=Streptomyces sp. NPDC014882 TaxID=3364927 RepID=UPI0036F85E23
MPTADEPGRPHERPVLEPVRVLRPRNTDALAELFRELDEAKGTPAPGHTRHTRGSGDTRDTRDPEDTGVYDSVTLPSEERTQELPPVPAARPSAARGPGPRRGVAAAAAVLAAALVGFGCALLLPDGGRDTAARTLPAATAPATTAVTAAPPADPDGPGTLREGATGPEVADLQQRLRRIPDVYDDGATDGRYDTVLTEAVARFQLWYGIRGDESGVYGDDTRRDLESRTG